MFIFPAPSSEFPSLLPQSPSSPSPLHPSARLPSPSILLPGPITETAKFATAPFPPTNLRRDIYPEKLAAVVFSPMSKLAIKSTINQAATSLSMWLGSRGGSGDTNGTSVKESLFADLFQEVKCAAPSAQLSYTLRCRLERCEREIRRIICERTKDGCSPLFVACKKGNVEVSDKPFFHILKVPRGGSFLS